MNTQFRVDLDQLNELSESLRQLKSEFAGLENALRAYEDDVGSPRVAESLHSFAENWSDKRRQVEKLLEDVATYAEQAHAAYSGVERELSAQITDAQVSSGRDSEGK